MDKPHSLKKCLFMNAYHADQINYIKIQLHRNQMKKKLQEVEHTRFLCSRADHEYMYTHIYNMIYKRMTAHKL